MHHQWLSLHNLDFTSQPLKYHFLGTYHFYLCLDIYVSTNLPNHFPWGQLFFQLVHGAFAISFHDWTLLPSMPLFFFFLVSSHFTFQICKTIDCALQHTVTFYWIVFTLLLQLANSSKPSFLWWALPFFLQTPPWYYIHVYV